MQNVARPSATMVVNLLSLLLLLLLFFLSAAPWLGQAHDDDETPTSLGIGGFVGVNGTRFVVATAKDGGGGSGGSTVYLSGFNAYWLMTTASDPARRGKVVAAFRQASAHGLNLARTWAFSDGGNAPLQTSPGVYDEAMFRGLDFVVAEAGRHGVYLLLCLTNNFPDFGGKRQYVRWANDEASSSSSSLAVEAGHRHHPFTTDDDFFNSSVVRGYYKNHVKTVLTRVNSFTGVAYKDDPTIFGWELMNEPRCDADPTGAMVQAWVEEMAPFVKSLDTNHLVTVGLEGFYGAGAHESKDLNPWRIYYGTNFVATHAVAGVDFATIHLYPDVWLWGAAADEQAEFFRNWTVSHVRDTQLYLGKPLLVTEYGKFTWDGVANRTQRDSFLAAVLDSIYDSAAGGGPLVGGAFWQLLDDGMDALRDGYEIILLEDPRAASIIGNHSRQLADLNNGRRRRSPTSPTTTRTTGNKIHLGRLGTSSSATDTDTDTDTDTARFHQILFVRYFVSLFRQISSFFFSTGSLL